MTAPTPPTPTQPKNYTLHTSIPYTPSPHSSQYLDLYLPHPTPTSQPPYPLLIYIHGGAFLEGDKLNPLLPLRLVTNSHYALASLNYRLSGTAPFPAAVQDCRAAVRYLRANAASYSIDPDKFVAIGESAGGYLAMMVGIPPPHHPEFDVGDHLDISSAVLGVVDLYGPTEFLSMDAQAPDHATLRHSVPGSPESLFLGHNITEVPELVKKASPGSYVGSWTPPVLVVHGTSDSVVPFGQGVGIERVLREGGRDVVLYPVEGVEHCFEGIGVGQEREMDGVVDGWLRGRFGR